MGERAIRESKTYGRDFQSKFMFILQILSNLLMVPRWDYSKQIEPLSSDQQSTFDFIVSILEVDTLKYITYNP